MASDFVLNGAAWDQLRNLPAVHEAMAGIAGRVCDAANAWAKSPSGEPDFHVVREAGKHRARYTVRPCTMRGVVLVSKDPAGFMACLESARG